MAKYEKFFQKVLDEVKSSFPMADIKLQTCRGGFSTTSGTVENISLSFYCDHKGISCKVGFVADPNFSVDVKLKNAQEDEDAKIFDMRLSFVITALSKIF